MESEVWRSERDNGRNDYRDRSGDDRYGWGDIGGSTSSQGGYRSRRPQQEYRDSSSQYGGRFGDNDYDEPMGYERVDYGRRESPRFRSDYRRSRGDSYGRSGSMATSEQEGFGNYGYGGRSARDPFEESGSYNRPMMSGSRRRPGRHSGKGPKGYRRSDEQINDEVCRRLEEHGDIDASEISVSCSDGIVTLEGTVEDRSSKREAEECLSDIYGVKDVMNTLTIDNDRSEPISSEGQRQDGGTSVEVRNGKAT